jgi:hypothetical protein
MPQFKLGQHSVRFDINPATDGGWRLTARIGLDDVWDEPIETGQTYPDRRQAKNAMHQELKKMRADGTYY